MAKIGDISGHTDEEIAHALGTLGPVRLKHIAELVAGRALAASDIAGPALAGRAVGAAVEAMLRKRRG